MYEIRRLIPEDAHLIIEYLKDEYFDCADLEDFWTLEEITQWIADNNDYCIGTWKDGAIVGLCLTHHHKTANKVHLENIYTVKSERNNGVATEMVRNILSYYSNKDERIRIIAQVDPQNEASLSVLKKNNFIVGDQMYWVQKNV